MLSGQSIQVLFNNALLTEVKTKWQMSDAIRINEAKALLFIVLSYCPQKIGDHGKSRPFGTQRHAICSTKISLASFIIQLRIW